MRPEGWQRKRVREFSERLKRVNTDGLDLEPLSITKDRGVILQSEKYKKRIATDPRKYVFAEDGDFAFDPMSLYYGAIGRVEGIGRGLVSPDYVVFKANSSVDPDFLHRLLRYPEMHKLYESLSETGNTFGKRRRLYWSIFEDIELDLPPRHEQTKIAAILASVDEAIEATQAVIEQLQVVKKAMMAELLTRGLPGRHTRFKQTEVGTMPEMWDLTRVGDLGSFAGGNGFRPPDWSTTGLPIIRIQNLNGSREFNYYAGKPNPDWIVEPGQLLFAWAGSRGASFGPCLWRGPTGVLNQHIHRITPGPRVLKGYLYYVLRLITEAIEKKAHGFKDTLVHLKKGELTGWPVGVPPIGEQRQILDTLLSLEARSEAEGSSLEGLRKTKSALMSVLLTGEVRVRLDPEPA